MMKIVYRVSWIGLVFVLVIVFGDYWLVKSGANVSIPMPNGSKFILNNPSNPSLIGYQTAQGIEKGQIAYKPPQTGGTLKSPTVNPMLVVTRADRSMDTLNWDSSMINIVTALERKGYVSSYFGSQQDKASGWGAMVRNGAHTLRMDQFSILAKGPVKDDPALYEVETQETDTITMKNADVHTVNQTIWWTLENVNGKWMINAQNIVSSQVS